jgi:hypothetical protein
LGGAAELVEYCAQVFVILHNFETSRKRILNVLHYHPAALIEMQIRAAVDCGFAGNHFHLQSLSDREMSQRFFRGWWLNATGAIDAFAGWSEGLDEFFDFWSEGLFGAGRF